MCQVSLRAGMCSPGELSDRTHSMSPTQKGERTHETRVRRTTLTTCYTDTSGNSFIHSSIHSFVHSFIRSFVHSFIRSFVHSSVAHKHARNGHALCDTKLNTLVARSRHFSQVVPPASPSSSSHVHRRGASRGYLVTHGCRFRFSSVSGGRAALTSSWLSTWSSCGSVFFLAALSSGLDSSASSGGVC